MKTMLSAIRETLATPAADATPAAEVHTVAAASIAVVTAERDMNSNLLEALPHSKLDALRQTTGNAAPAAATNESAMNFKLRDLTLPYVAFDSAAPKSLPSMGIAAAAEKVTHLGNGPGVAPEEFKLGSDRMGRDIMLGRAGFKVPGGGNGPDGPIDPRADLGEGDSLGKMPGVKGARIPWNVVLPGGVVPGGDPDNDPRAGGDGDGDGTGRQPRKIGPGPRGDDLGLWGFDSFHAFDLDDLMPRYRDPDLDPRAQDGSCGSTGCGTTNTPDCGHSSCGDTNSCGTTSCGNTGSCGATDSCGSTSCGNTGSCGSTNSCGSTSCGNTGSCGATDSCGATSCGDTHACGTTNSPGFDPYTLYTRTELLRQQLISQLVIANVKQLG
jgi:hypothetical protein